MAAAVDVTADRSSLSGGAASGLPPAPDEAASPCIGVCRIDEASGWCLGCLRSLDEIAGWSAMGLAERRDVLDRLAGRSVRPVAR